ncbi:MAG: tRNA (N6-isopentenyl adenosine(37)-C2)-methylthiotransferase MiaB [Bacteroidales bacterium]|nr:tRNA (N6-isopentenyl adenosine(37)-C2)-methylthiotransferase MiaB [Bacteroidales bacterium]
MGKKKFYIETHGCQMNFSDSEIASSVMIKNNFEITDNPRHADVILINTCSVRDNAEQRARNRLKNLTPLKKKKKDLIIGIIGCMAERIKEQLFEEEKKIDLIAGPDAYRNLPRLIETAAKKSKAINVKLSREETYDDITPFKIENKGISAFISIMRGCENFCSYCVVPFTRGKERSRNPETIIKEAKNLFSKGYREIILLGQNVNSYKWNSGFGFVNLLESVAGISPLLRVRFTTSHPKDLSDELLYVISKNENICMHIHLPMQSGSTRILNLMNRKYSREWYMNRIEAIKKIIPGCSVTTDIISGFCTETEEDHKSTLSLIEEAGFDYAYMFKYSERPDTPASTKYKDDVPEEVKLKRLQEVISLQRKLSHKSNINDLNKTFEVLIEGESKKNKNNFYGRNSQNKVIIFSKQKNYRIGDYINIKVTGCTSATLIGEVE